MVAKVTLLGAVFGRMTVVAEAPSDGRARWVCRCACGAVKTVAGHQLRRGSVQSCGCLRVDAAREKAVVRNIGGYKGYAKYKTYEDYLRNTTPVGGCLEWNGPVYKNGYAKFGSNQRIPTNVGHRAVFFLVNGYVPEVVRHTCDNRRCINPAHLLPGTTADNIQDRVMRKRDLSMRKLTEADVLEIRRLRSEGATSPALAKRFGVSKQCILSVINRKTWSHI